MRAGLAILSLLAMGTGGCASPAGTLSAERAAELQRESRETLDECASGGYVDAGLCLSLELIQAEYELCRDRGQESAGDCDQVWAAVPRVRTELETEPWRPPPLLDSRPW